MTDEESRRRRDAVGWMRDDEGWFRAVGSAAAVVEVRTYPHECREERNLVFVVLLYCIVLSSGKADWMAGHCISMHK